LNDADECANDECEVNARESVEQDSEEDDDCGRSLDEDGRCERCDCQTCGCRLAECECPVEEEMEVV
jgi:hypothetical protein